MKYVLTSHTTIGTSKRYIRKQKLQPLGSYKLFERQQGLTFLDFYDFYSGADSLGSAGYNTYVNRERALHLGLANVTQEFVTLKSASTAKGPRESVRLEGKTRFDRGLFLLDLDHMPAGCGVWPAFWLTNEDHWPDHGEIDIMEGVNYQTTAKTALHTSESCTMYAHDPRWEWTGVWDNATGIPNTYTGIPATEIKVPADNCWVMAPHQWANQGCVAVDSRNYTIGEPLNEQGGGVYALEWDPANGYIKSWAFTPHDSTPTNLHQAMATSSLNQEHRVAPDPKTWGPPYAYFAIGKESGCSSNHFQNIRLIFNLAFCGTVSGNRFFTDCPRQQKIFNVSNDPVLSCNAWIHSQPEELAEAYWKIRGVYVYERDMIATPNATKVSD